MSRPLPASLAPALAVGGVVLWGYAIGSSFGYVARGPTPAENALILAALGLGLACHLGAVAVSLLRWRRAQGPPVVAMLYGAVIVFGTGAWAWSQGEEGRFLRATPGAFAIDQGDGGVLDVRDADGVWQVPLDACPGQGDTASGRTLGTRQHDGVADVSYGDGGYYMRLHVAERRVECFGPDGPPPAPDAMRVEIGSPLVGTTVVELRGDTLVHLAPDLDTPPDTTVTVPSDADWRAFRATLDSVRVWQWRDRYDTPDVVDGTDWSVEIDYADGRVSSSGSNRYPGPRGEPRDAGAGQAEGVRTTAEFDRFTEAVERLSGHSFR